MSIINQPISYLGSDQATLLAGHNLSALVGAGDVVFLEGALGVGKTTLVRGLLRGYGYQKAVVSPSYTLIETYEVNGLMICHIDLYRITANRLADIGIRDYFDGHCLCLIEWPERAIEALPTPDLCCYLEIVDNHRLLHLAGSHHSQIKFSLS